MPIAQVQKGIDSTNSDATSLTVTFGAGPTQGNLLIAGISLRGNGSGPTWPSGWTEAINLVGTTLGAIAFKIAGAGETSDVAVSWPGSGGAVIPIAEYSGIDATPLDATASSSNNNATSRSAGDLITTVDDELLFCICAVRQDMGAWVSWSASFVDQAGEVSASASVASLQWSDRIVSATGTYNNTGTWTNAQAVVACAATFKAGAALGVDILAAVTEQAPTLPPTPAKVMTGF